MVILRTYTDGEIRTAYRQAKNKREQLSILADLNCCSVADIRRILETGEDKPVETRDKSIHGDRSIAQKRRNTKEMQKRQKNDWDAIFADLPDGIDDADAVRAAAHKHRVSTQQIRRTWERHRSEMDTAGQGQAEEDRSIPLEAAANSQTFGNLTDSERDAGDELLRIHEVLGFVRPGDDDTVRGCVCDLVKALAGQWVVRGYLDGGS